MKENKESLPGKNQTNHETSNLVEVYPLFHEVGKELMEKVKAHLGKGNASELPESVWVPIVTKLITGLSDHERWESDPELRALFGISVLLLSVGSDKRGDLALLHRFSEIPVLSGKKKTTIQIPQSMHPYDLVLLADKLKMQEMISPRAVKYVLGMTRHHDDREVARTYDTRREKWRMYTEQEIQGKLLKQHTDLEFMNLMTRSRQALTEYEADEIPTLFSQEWNAVKKLVHSAQPRLPEDRLKGTVENILSAGSLEIKLLMFWQEMLSANNRDAALAIFYTELLDKMVDARDFVLMHRKRLETNSEYPFEYRLKKHGARILARGNMLKEEMKSAEMLNEYFADCFTRLEQMVLNGWEKGNIDVTSGLLYSNEIFSPTLREAKKIIEPLMRRFL